MSDSEVRWRGCLVAAGRDDLEELVPRQGSSLPVVAEVGVQREHRGADEVHVVAVLGILFVPACRRTVT